MAKKKKASKKKTKVRSDKYESKLAIKGTLDEVLKASLNK